MGAAAVMGNKLFFVTNAELWVSDGTAAGTFRTMDTNPAGMDQVGSLAAVGNVVYFSATDGAAGAELWRSDGTPAGTFFVQDIRPGPASSVPSALVARGPDLFFAAVDTAAGTEVWALLATPAPPPPPRSHLIVDVVESGGGRGSVHLSPPEANCWGTGSGTSRCEFDFEPGTIVTLTAPPKRSAFRVHRLERGLRGRRRPARWT